MGAGGSSRGSPAPRLADAPPEDFRVEEDEEENTKYLRFANTVWNAGRGPLELRGESDPEAEKVRVTQVVHSEEGAAEEREVGAFVHHPDHDHWHVEDFALYELRSLTPDGEYAPRLVADPENRIAESDAENNEDVVYLEIGGDDVEKIEKP